MSKPLLLSVLFLSLSACAMEDPEAEHDDIASQESAVEEAPAPEEGAELWGWLFRTCRNSCDTRFSAQNDLCLTRFFIDTEAYSVCADAAYGDNIDCLGGCSALINHP